MKQSNINQVSDWLYRWSQGCEEAGYHYMGAPGDWLNAEVFQGPCYDAETSPVAHDFDSYGREGSVMLRQPYKRSPRTLLIMEGNFSMYRDWIETLRGHNPAVLVPVGRFDEACLALPDLPVIGHQDDADFQVRQGTGITVDVEELRGIAQDV